MRRGGCAVSMRLMAMSSVSGVAAKAPLAEAIRPERRRKRTRVILRCRGRGGCGVSFGASGVVCLFMVDVRLLLLILHVGRRRARLES